MVKYRLSQKGSALLMALFITAISTIITMGLIERQQINIHRSELILNSNQAYLYTQGAVVWAKHFLSTDIYPGATNNTPPNNAANASANSLKKIIKWPVVMPPQKLPDGTVVNAILMDGQSFFNMNNLIDINQQGLFLNLLKNILPSGYQQNIPSIVSALVAWITPPEQGTNINLEEYYLNHQPPYKSAHQLFTTVSEIRMVKGISPAIYNLISPYIIALPEKTNLNVNSAPALLVLSLSSNAETNNSAQLAQQLTALRDQKGGFANLTEFNQSSIVQQLGLGSESNFTTTSDYFLLRVEVDSKNIHMTLFALLKRKVDANNNPSAKILWQSIGTN